MSFENQGQCEQNPQAEAGDVSQKRFKISYARDFLLSLSELDVCKKLPSGFDESILSEFEDVSQDRFKASGGFSSQIYRRNDYSSSPPTRGDGCNYSRGIHGRWDSRSSGRSDRDSDSQSDLDSDSAKCGNQSRRSWQVPEHDGLLGSGSFPRPPVFVTGTSGPKSRNNDHYQVNRSTEPYHPPRPYKAVAHLRRDTHDSFNDETFGSPENTSEDRAEEERKRRVSFELMRKEQHKAFKEKQKNPEKSEDNFDFSELLEGPKDDKKFLNRRYESDETIIHSSSNNDSDMSSFPSAAPLARPLVPPGFSSPIVEKNPRNKPLIHLQPLEIGNEPDGSLFHAKENRVSSGDSNNQEEKQSLEEIDCGGQLLDGPSIRFSVNKQSKKIQNFSLAVGKTVDQDRQCNVLEPLDATETCEIVAHDGNDVLGSRVVGGPTPTHSTSILDKLFGSALTLNDVDSSSTIEHYDVKADDEWTPHMVQSSKFARWFLGEEKKSPDDHSSRPNKHVEDFSSDRSKEPADEPSFGSTTKSVDDLSSERSNDLLSLITGGEKSGSMIFGGEKNGLLIVGVENGRSFIDDTKKSGSQVFDIKVTESIPPSFPHQLAGIADVHVAPNSVFRSVESIDKIEPVPPILTCEDLEQSILSEITENVPVLPPPLESWNSLVAETAQKKAEIDNRASQHLLSLLQKGPEPSTDVVSSVGLQNFEKENLRITFLGSNETENIPSAGKPLTLETLFGTAFMKELKSAGAPASGQSGLSDSMGVGVSESSFLVMDNIIGSTADIASSIPSRGNSLLASNERAQVTPGTIGEKILGFDIQSSVDSPELQSEFRSKLVGFDGSSGVRLPEEAALISANDPLYIQKFISGRNLAKAELLSAPGKAVDIADELAALNPVYQEERNITGREEGQAIFRDPYDVQYHKIHGQSSFPQLHPSQLNHAGPRFHSLDSHPANNNAQMKFMVPENIIHHKHPNHQFPVNLLRPPFHHPANGLTGLDPNPHNPILQQMHMPGNIPPHLSRGFLNGARLTPDPNNQVTSFMQEPNLMQGFSFVQKQPNFGGPGIPPQGAAADIRSETPHPEALQRIIEMELRLNTKQICPLPAAGHNQGIYGHELDIGFSFR